MRPICPLSEVKGLKCNGNQGMVGHVEPSVVTLGWGALMLGCRAQGVSDLIGYAACAGRIAVWGLLAAQRLSLARKVECLLKGTSSSLLIVDQNPADICVSSCTLLVWQ